MTKLTKFIVTQTTKKVAGVWGYPQLLPQIIPCLSYCPAGIMVISMRSEVISLKKSQICLLSQQKYNKTVQLQVTIIPRQPGKEIYSYPNFGLEITVIVKIESNPWYPIIWDWFQWRWKQYHWLFELKITVSFEIWKIQSSKYFFCPHLNQSQTMVA